MVSADPTDRALSFGAVAEEYDRWRTGYPAAAVGWLAPESPARVAELGAGTGKLTALLVARGLVVEAIEPDPRMLAVLTRNVPQARPHRSDSATIPVDDHVLDAVLVTDAWHWFDPDPTITELRRVLRPGGRLGLVWNVTARPTEAWAAAMAGELADNHDQECAGCDAMIRTWYSYFPPDEVEVARFEWTRQVTPEEHASSWATTSAAITMSPTDREAEVAVRRAAFQAACDEAGKSSIPVRSVASCIRWTPQVVSSDEQRSAH